MRSPAFIRGSLLSKDLLTAILLEALLLYLSFVASSRQNGVGFNNELNRETIWQHSVLLLSDLSFTFIRRQPFLVQMLLQTLP
jgi:hypothetical protein